MKLNQKAESGGLGSKSVFYPILACGVGVVAILAIALAMSDEGYVASDVDPAEEEVAEQRPTGAGTNPDGVADEPVEGLTNDTSTDDFVDSSASASAEVVGGDSGGDGEEPATTAENVEPAAGESDNIDEMVEAVESAPEDETGASDNSMASGTDGDMPEGDVREGESETSEDGTESATTEDDQALMQSSPPLADIEGDVAPQTTAMVNGDKIAEGITGSLPENVDPSNAPDNMIVDPNNGYMGTDPDGGAGAFVPTPSGPEGRDDNPFTTN